MPPKQLTLADLLEGGAPTPAALLYAQSLNGPTPYRNYQQPRSMPRQMRPPDIRAAEDNPGVRDQALSELIARRDAAQGANLHEAQGPANNQFADAGMQVMEMTGVPAIRRSYDAFDRGDWREGTAEGAVGALGLAGTLGMIPGRSRGPAGAVHGMPEPPPAAASEGTRIYRGINQEFDPARAAMLGDRWWHTNPEVASSYAPGSDGAHVMPGVVDEGSLRLAHIQTPPGTMFRSIPVESLPADIRNSFPRSTTTVNSHEVAAAAESLGYEGVTFSGMRDSGYGGATDSYAGFGSGDEGRVFAVFNDSAVRPPFSGTPQGMPRPAPDAGPSGEPPPSAAGGAQVRKLDYPQDERRGIRNYESPNVSITIERQPGDATSSVSWGLNSPSRVSSGLRERAALEQEGIDAAIRAIEMDATANPGAAYSFQGSHRPLIRRYARIAQERAEAAGFAVSEQDGSLVVRRKAIPAPPDGSTVRPDTSKSYRPGEDKNYAKQDMTDRPAVMQFAEDPWSAWTPQAQQHGQPSGADPFAPGPPPNVAQDVARSSVTGAQRGAAGLAGMMGDIQELGPQSAGVMRYWQLRSQGASDEEARAGAQRYIDAAHTFNQRPGGVQFPTSQDVNGAIENTFGQQHEPETMAGEYASTISSFWPNALFPGGAVSRTARVAIPGAASELGGQLTEGTPAEPYARVGGALAGGIATEGMINIGNAPDRMLAVALEGATDADLVAAQQLQERAASMGINLTRAEALEQVTHGGTGMTALQDFVETSRHGAPVMAPYMRNRPEQTANAINDWANRVAPPTPNPSVLGVRGQRAADEILTAERRAINTRAQGNYDALANETMPDAEFAQLAGDPTFQQTLNAVRNSPILNSGLESLPDNNLAVVNRVAQQMRQMSENTLPNPNRETGSHFVSSQYSRGAAQTEGAASQASQQYAQPSNWDEGRRIVSEGRAATLDPLEAGPLGRMSRTPDVMGPTGQTRSLFPDAPPAGGASETEEAMRRLVQADPDAASGLARQHVLGGRTGAQEQLQALSGGENQFGMAKWAATIAGNPEQQQALLAGFRALPNGAPLADELADLIEVGQATGRRAASGSRTAMRTEYGEQARHVLPEVQKLASDAFRGGRVRRLAEFLTDHPSETAAALRVAREQGHQPIAESMLSTLILSRPKGEREHAR